MEPPLSVPDFEDFVHGSGQRLLRFAILMCGDPSDAEDLLQTVLEQTYPRWSRLRDGDPERYVRRAIANRVISQWRSPWIRRRVAEVPETATLGDEMARADDRALLLRALRSLPPRMRAVVVMRYWAGWSEKETAAALGCSVGAVKSQSSRGLDRLRDLLSGAGSVSAGTSGGGTP
ncbi:SigE family RNA polymerase sigma factor [Salinispora oceanensis]|uniref:SigE family RNA polymerase sigma factor n=1 Tax=Salinispora oceanensis TaxID=1050199 RepID=UPI00035DBC59|nr:SigE family RNA polymerase sigma factor [Salinispora oceanensis]